MAGFQLSATVVVGKGIPSRFKSGGAEVRRAIRRELEFAQLLLRDSMVVHAKEKLTRHTGNLFNFVIEPVVSHGGRMGYSGRVGSPMIYAPIQEYGGTIHAKNWPHLAIPLKAIKTELRTQARATARNVIANPGAFGFSSTFYRSSSQIIFGRSSEGTKPLFKLQESVTLPARPYAQPAINEVAPVFEAKMESAIAEIFKG